MKQTTISSLTDDHTNSCVHLEKSTAMADPMHVRYYADEGVDMLMELSNRPSEPPKPEQVVADRLPVAKIDVSKVRCHDSDDIKVEAVLSGEGKERMLPILVRGASLVRDCQHKTKRVADVTAAAAEKVQKVAKHRSGKCVTAKQPTSPGHRNLMAQRRQEYVFRLAERKRVENFRQKAAFSLARKMLPEDKIREMEDVAATIFQNSEKRKRERRHKREATIETPVGVSGAIFDHSRKRRALERKGDEHE